MQINQDLETLEEDKLSFSKLKHDELFRAIISEPLVYIEFFDHHLPQNVKNLIELSSIKIEKSDFINEYLKESICDVLFSAKLKGSSEIGYLNLLLEAQSKSDWKMSFRMIKYMIAICERHFKNHPKSKKLPLIYPIIFSNAENNTEMSLDFFELFEKPYLAKEFWSGPYQLIDLNKIPDSEIVTRLFSGTMEFVMKHGRDEDYIERLEQIGDNLRAIISDKNINGTDYISKILCYNIKNIDEWKDLTLKQVLNKILPQSLGDDIMGSLAEKWYHEGETSGIQAGIQIGSARGETKGKILTAKNMLDDGMSINAISKYTGLSIDEINKIKSGANITHL